MVEGLCADFDEGKVARVRVVHSEQRGAGCGDEFAEQRRIARGEKIRARRAAHAAAWLAVIAEPRIVQRELHEMGKGHRVPGAGAAEEEVDELR